MNDVTLEGVLFALSNSVRLQIVAQLSQSRCAQNCTRFINVRGSELPKSTLSQHFRVLREAGLIRSERQGVELHNTVRCAELRERFGPLVETILNTYLSEHAVTGKKR